MKMGTKRNLFDEQIAEWLLYQNINKTKIDIKRMDARTHAKFNIQTTATTTNSMRLTQHNP